jgi:branched-subunit amino acid aminotransferase/4-amino-4-deoxychorismate lyase
MGEAFELLETIRWTPGHGFFLLDRHLTRLAASARHFGYACDTADLRAALDRAVAASAGALRVRLLLAHDGSARVECAVLDPVTSPARVAFADAPVDRGDVFLYHKTTNRRVYDAARRPDADDVILWNADRQVTETTIANIVAEIGGRKLTPPVECGLLPGTFRAQLLDDQVIEEGVITLDQIREATGLWLVNSVREWRAAQLGAQTAAAMASTPISASTSAAAAEKRSQR